MKFGIWEFFQIFMRFDVWEFFRKYVEKVQDSLKSKKRWLSFVMCVCQSVYNNSTPTEPIFMKFGFWIFFPIFTKFDVWEFFYKICRESQDSLKSKKGDLASSCVSVSPYRTTRVPLSRISLNLVLQNFFRFSWNLKFENFF